MIFMSQSGITDPARAADWDAWYVEHLRIMLTVPGIHSAQRFKTDSPDYPPSLAMYSIAGAEVFDDPYYRSVRGLGEWLPLIERRYYRRNLFAGLDHAPAVAAGARRVVADRDREDAALADMGLTWLACVAIDRTTPLRGIGVLDASRAASIAHRALALYLPVTEYMSSGAAR